jgi:hypothetical protein
VGLTPSCDTQQTFYVSNAENIQEWPDICYGLGNYVVVWTDFRNGIDRLIRAARVTPQWVVQDTGNIVCSNATYQITPVVAFDGTRFLIVWQNLADPYGIYCRFLGGDGLPQDSVIMVSSSVTATNPRIVYGGSRFFIVWQEYNLTNNIVGRFISPDGGLVGDPFEITSGPENHVSPGICYDGNHFLVVWAQNDIYGRFVSETGNLIGDAFAISTLTSGQVNPDVYFGDGKYLAVWSEFRTDYDIYGNIDVEVSLEESSYDTNMEGKVFPNKTIFVDRVNVIGGIGKVISVFDISGQKVAETRNGVWEPPLVPAGVYFLSVDNAYVFKVVKVK